MKDKMETLVRECLIQHQGGEMFFDALDEKLRNDNSLIIMMIGRILERETFDYLIVSGHFGDVFYSFCEDHLPKLKNSIIVVNGGLRRDEAVCDFWNFYDISGKRFIFLDDSYYLGRTRDKIKESLEDHDGILIRTYVFYDGSKELDKDVYSFYRYYDHYFN